MEAVAEINTSSPERSNQAPSGSAKRKRYTPIACDECKRRKVKCDGQTPCRRCAQYSTGCVYVRKGTIAEGKQEIEWKQMNEKLEGLQEQINILVSNAAATAQPAQQIGPATPVSTLLSEPSHRPSHVTQNVVSRRWYLPPHLEGSDVASPVRSTQAIDDFRRIRDPLCAIPRNEAIRLIAVYDEECGSIYPFLDNQLILKAAHDFYDTAESGEVPPFHRMTTSENMLSGGVLNILKLVIATAVVIENSGSTTLSAQLLDSVESGFEGRVCGAQVDILEIQAWTAMSILQFHCDEEILAWRTIGMAARAAVENGLHRRTTYFARIHDRQQRLWANRLFWCIYVLDRRWSFGVDLPFAINDEDIDPGVPEPEPNDASSYLLRTMIAYGRLGSKVWKATTKSATAIPPEQIAFLDFRVRQWQDSIAPEWQLHPQSDHLFNDQNRTKNRLRVLLYLRANQMRLQLFRQTLLSPQTISENFTGAQRVVDVAKDNIRMLDKLNRTSDIYSSQQTCFNYFLIAALSVLFLATCHGTAHFSETFRAEFFMALELVRGLSGRSHIALKLWKSIKHLRVVGHRLGIFSGSDQDGRRPTETRDGTAPRQVSALGRNSAPEEELSQNDLAPLPALSPFYDDQLDGIQLSNELTDLFETIEPVYGEYPSENVGHDGGFDLKTYGTAEDLSRSLMDLF